MAGGIGRDFIVGQVLLTPLKQQPSQLCPTFPAQSRIEACDQTVIYSVVVVSDLLKHQLSQFIRIDTCSFRQGSQIIAGSSKDITGVAIAVVDELQDRGVQFYELPEQIDRKPGIFDADIFDDHRAQSIKFDDDLAASLIRRHGT